VANSGALEAKAGAGCKCELEIGGAGGAAQATVKAANPKLSARSNGFKPAEDRLIGTAQLFKIVDPVVF
jgi:hypothetical protein